jgi:anaerobic C4-dicarboxylate transporter
MENLSISDVIIILGIMITSTFFALLIILIRDKMVGKPLPKDQYLLAKIKTKIKNIWAKVTFVGFLFFLFFNYIFVYLPLKLLNK